MPQSLRTAFIRISAKNNTEKGLVEYSKKDIGGMVSDITSRYSGTKYAYICHDRDVSPDGATPTHFHVFLKFVNPVGFKYIKEAFPYGDIESARSTNACIQYLIHKNNPEKMQYQKAEICTNYQPADFDALFLNDKKAHKRNDLEELDEILQDIADFKIRRFNMSEHISVQMYSKYRPRIENAFKYRDIQFMANPQRDIKVVFISGPSGSGKTTFAKFGFADGYSGVCVSSSSNDPMQDYSDQDVLILDDLRDDDFKFQDLLKILDPHTSSSIKSRYNNKVFMGKLIVITSYKKLEEWYSSVPLDARSQLFRRISSYIMVDETQIAAYDISLQGNKIVKVQTHLIQNPVTDLKKAESNRSNELLDNAFTSIEIQCTALMPVGLAAAVAEADAEEQLPF